MKISQGIVVQIVFLLLFELCVHHLSNGKNIEFPKDNNRVQYANPDQKGYRYCSFWRLPDGTPLLSTCDPFTLNRCGQTLDFDYSCCSGFEEIDDSMQNPGGIQLDKCSKMTSPYKNCPEAISKQNGGAEFSNQLSSLSDFNSDNPQESYTVFAPRSQGSNGEPQADEHVVKGRFYIDDMKDGMVLKTLDPKRQLYVTRHSYGVVSIDCVEVVNADLECKNGIIHTIRQSLTKQQKFDRSSVMKLLESNSETQTFAQDLPDSLKNDLRSVDSGKRYTVMVPKNWATVRSQYSGEKLKKVAANHVLPTQQCSSGLIRSSESHDSSGGETLDFICETSPQGKEQHFVKTECGKRREFLEADLTAQNGVVHIIDQSITPMSAMTLEELQEDEECKKHLKIKEFMDLLKECDLLMKGGKKYAVIVPQDSSFLWWSNYEQFKEEYERFKTDKEYRCKVARYHVVENDGRMDNIPDFGSNTQGHRTNNPKDFLYETTYFKKTPYGSQLNFHYSPINDLSSYEMDGVTLYLTPRINVPPEKNLTDILKSRPDTTIANNQTIEAKMDENHFQKNAPKNLYLVTTDDGWKDPREGPNSKNPYRPELNMYKGKNLNNYLLLHHVPLYLWGGDIGYFDKNTVHKFMSSAGVELTFWMDEKGVMRIGYDDLPRDKWPRVIKWNLPARDGIMWLLDGVLQCPEKLCPLLAEDIDTYDIYVSACRSAKLEDEDDLARRFQEKPVDIGKRHPEDCTVLLQVSEETRTLIET